MKRRISWTLVAILATIGVLGAAWAARSGSESEEVAAPEGVEALSDDRAPDGSDERDSGDSDGNGGLQRDVGRAEYSPEPAASTGVERVSARSGAWSDAATWADGEAPGPGDEIVIVAGHEVSLDVDALVDGMTLDGTLRFAPDRSVSLGSSANIVATGLLEMIPADGETTHVLEFLGVDESQFVGGGVQPIEEDVGLWVMGSGQLNLRGAERRGWTRLAEPAPSGETRFAVEDATGWRVGDEIVITPTGAPQAGSDAANTWDGFFHSVIEAVEGNTITLANESSQAYELVAGRYLAEVMNLTRNVIIQGTSAGRSHVFIHTNELPHFIQWVSLDRLGVTDALGRYPLHFHRGGQSSWGSLVEGVVVRSGSNHAFVPHESHGITMRDLVAYDISSNVAYWWDLGDSTNDLVWEHVLAARTADSGFLLGLSENSTIRDAVAVGVVDGSLNSAGFIWENNSNGNWWASDLVAHNNNNRGIRIWQNSDIPQVVEGFASYYNTGAGLEHGAYTNRYTFKDGHLFGNWEAGVVIQAVTWSDPEQVVLQPEITFENLTIDTGGIGSGPPVSVRGSAVPAFQPTLFTRLVVPEGGSGDQPVFAFENPTQQRVRCLDCELPESAEPVYFTEAREPDETWFDLVSDEVSMRYRPVEVDPDASFSADSAAWVAEIDRPVPLDIGDGTGLVVEYFQDPELTESIYKALFPNPIEDRWGEYERPFYRVDTSDGAGARWTGEIEIPTTEGGTYEFGIYSSVGVRMWVDGRLLIEELFNDYSETFTGSIELDGGRRYDIVMEIYDDFGSERFSFQAFWERPDGRAEQLPTSQLYAVEPAPITDPEIATPPN